MSAVKVAHANVDDAHLNSTPVKLVRNYIDCHGVLANFMGKHRLMCQENSILCAINPKKIVWERSQNLQTFPKHAAVTFVFLASL